MSAAPLNGRITVTLNWQGPTQWKGGWKTGGADAEVVELVSDSTSRVISALIPKDLTAKPQKFSFMCRKYGDEVGFGKDKFRPLESETRLETLTLTIEEVRTVIIKVGMLEKKQGPGYWDFATRMVVHTLNSEKTERTVTFVVPRDLEPGATYQLTVQSSPETSENTFTLEARLVKEASLTAPAATTAAAAMATTAAAPTLEMSYADLVAMYRAIDENEDLRSAIKRINKALREQNTVENLQRMLEVARKEGGEIETPIIKTDLIKLLKIMVDEKKLMPIAAEIERLRKQRVDDPNAIELAKKLPPPFRDKMLGAIAKELAFNFTDIAKSILAEITTEPERTQVADAIRGAELIRSGMQNLQLALTLARNG